MGGLWWRFDWILLIFDKSYFKVERRYGRKHGCDPATLAAGRGAHLHANWSFSPPPTLMTMKLPMVGDHI
jgi:hypothetical protein